MGGVVNYFANLRKISRKLVILHKIMKFTLQHRDKQTNARAGEMVTDHGVIQTPIFMPVGHRKRHPAGLHLVRRAPQTLVARPSAYSPKWRSALTVRL